LQLPSLARQSQEGREGASCRGDTSAAEASQCQPYLVSCPEASRQQLHAFRRIEAACPEPFLVGPLKVAGLGERLGGAEVVAADALASAEASDAFGIAALDDVEYPA
jgi:hypothetical protein